MPEAKLSTPVDPPLLAADATSGRWYVLGVLTFVYTINIADRVSLSTLVEPIKAEFALSDSAVGFLTGAALAIFYVSAGIPLATLADRWNRRNMVVAALFSWSLMTALCGMAQNMWQLLAARIGVGVGEAGGTPPSTAIIGDKFLPKDRAMALTIFTLGSPAGFWIGSSITGRIAESFGWRVPLLCLGALGIVGALIVWTTVREPQRGQLDSSKVDRTPIALPDTLRLLARRRSIVHLLMGSTMHALWGGALIWWTPAFLMRSHGMSIGEVGTTIGPMHLVGGTACILVTSWLMTRRTALDPRYKAGLMAGSTVVGTLASLVAFSATDTTVTIVMLWIFVTVHLVYFGPTIALLQNLVPPGMRAQTLAVFLFMINVGTLIIAPQLLGIMSDLFAATYGSESLRWALVMMTPGGIWSAYHFWAARKTLREDIALVVGHTEGG